MSVRSVPAQKLIENLTQKLKKELEPPEWAKFVKTGVAKERPPQQPDWWARRAASILRKIWLKPGLGVARLRKEYSSRKNRGHKPERRYPASGAVIRRVLQQLEAKGYVEKREKGRYLTKKGMELLKEAAK
ncbi:MAG: 30S ribosomal protein S19e [Candidatus Aenigmatarchaeota archaeon]|nr:MAG: 30S ribosomal protein S19e [Candidatus Aenigmarchaeota archaeon]